VGPSVTEVSKETPLPPKAVLVVEDEPGDVTAIAKAFEKAGYSESLRVAKDVEEATAYFRGIGRFSDRSQYPVPSLVLLDLHLPGESGFLLLEWLRRQGDFHRIPVIMLTSSSDYQDIKKAFALGANSYISKPKTLPELIGAIKTLLTYWLELHRQA
jgi:CheY-like chemotaxis protein